MLSAKRGKLVKRARGPRVKRAATMCGKRCKYMSLPHDAACKGQSHEQPCRLDAFRVLCWDGDAKAWSHLESKPHQNAA
jgi:hypothetical protein